MLHLCPYFLGFPTDNKLEEFIISGVTFSSATFFDGLSKLESLTISGSRLIPFAGKPYFSYINGGLSYSVVRLIRLIQ